MNQKVSIVGDCGRTRPGLRRWTAATVVALSLAATLCAVAAVEASITFGASLAGTPASSPVLVAQNRGAGSRPPRGSSAELHGGSSAERYGGTSADRTGVAGRRDPRVYGKPQRVRRMEEKAARNERRQEDGEAWERDQQ